MLGGDREAEAGAAAPPWTGPPCRTGRTGAGGRRRGRLGRGPPRRSRRPSRVAWSATSTGAPGAWSRALSSRLPRIRSSRRGSDSTTSGVGGQRDGGLGQARRDGARSPRARGPRARATAARPRRRSARSPSGRRRATRSRRTSATSSSAGRRASGGRLVEVALDAARPRRRARSAASAARGRRRRRSAGSAAGRLEARDRRLERVGHPVELRRPAGRTRPAAARGTAADRSPAGDAARRAPGLGDAGGGSRARSSPATSSATRSRRRRAARSPTRSWASASSIGLRREDEVELRRASPWRPPTTSDGRAGEVLPRVAESRPRRRWRAAPARPRPGHPAGRRARTGAPSPKSASTRPDARAARTRRAARWPRTRGRPSGRVRAREQDGEVVVAPAGGRPRRAPARSDASTNA